MSKISLEPNASGAGTFTLAAPNSNTNRTLNLPDESGTLTTTASLALAGEVCYFAMSTAPDGFLKANGAAISRTAFSALFDAIGTTFGVGDGSTTFNLPDLRGEFIRGLDDGRGVDSGRSFGSGQLDAFQSHIHDNGDGGHGSDVINQYGIDTTGQYQSFRLSSRRRHSQSNSGANPPPLTSPPLNNLGPFSSLETPRIANETRSRNVALLACIKF